MIQLNNLTDAAVQNTAVTLEDGSILNLTISYKGGAQRWTFDISHPTIELNGQNLCQSPNLLRPFRNNIPFGISCVAADGTDPVDIMAFASGRVALFILNASDIKLVESQIYGELLQ